MKDFNIDEECPFFKNIKEKEINSIRDKYRISYYNRKFNSKSLLEISEKIKYLINNDSNATLSLYIDVKTIADPPCVTVLTYLIYYTLMYSNINIHFDFNIKKLETINFEFFISSMLFKYNHKYIEKNLYIKDFEKTTIKKDSYRAFVYNDEKREHTMNKIYSDLPSFFKTSDSSIDTNFIEDLSETISELIANAIEHGKANCLLEINCYKGYKYRRRFSDESTLISITVSNVSDSKLHEKLQTNHELSKIYNEDLNKALTLHSKCFDENYSKEDFYAISTFQKGISCRENQQNSGGTGLYYTIMHILEAVDTDYCYFLFGNRILYLQKEFIKPVNNYIGFNKEHDYLNNIPNVNKIFSKSAMHFNGTLIHLTLVPKKGEIYENKNN